MARMIGWEIPSGDEMTEAMVDSAARQAAMQHPQTKELHAQIKADMMAAVPGTGAAKAPQGERVEQVQMSDRPSGRPAPKGKK
jgi:hypothetical protein